MRIKVIGVGPGDELLMTTQAQNAIVEADTVFAAARHRHLTKHAQPLEPIATICQRIRDSYDGANKIAVLVSGDPMLYSLCNLLTEAFGHESITVIPGISALQAFSAAINVPWQDAAILSGHGRDLTISRFGHTVRTNGRTYLFCDRTHNAAWAADALTREGLSHVRMTTGERLSYADQRILRGMAQDFIKCESDPLSMILLQNESPASGLPFIGISDEEFLRGKTPMTKRATRVQILSYMHLKMDSVVWDIGAGTGSVTIECARQIPMGKVYAIEQKMEAARLIQQNIEKFHTNNVEIVEGRAPEALHGLEAPTHVFLGGTEGEAKHILHLLRNLGSPIHLTATAATLEGITDLIEAFSDPSIHNAEVIQLSVSAAEPLGHYHLLRAQNPVMLFTGCLENEQ